MGKYFGTDGFRGEANVTLKATHAYGIGRFLGWYFSTSPWGSEGHKARVAVGKDTRRSSYMLEYGLVAGLTASGADVYMLHVTTTPSVSFVTRQDGFDCGVMISASHNPFSDNGIKLVNSQGEKISDHITDMIEAYLDEGAEGLRKFLPQLVGDDLPLATGEDLGQIIDHASGRNRYIGYLISLAAHTYQPYRIGLDLANGAAWSIAKAVFEALGATVYVIGDNPNGTNINQGVGSTHIQALQQLVVAEGLDMGFAFDGDADRCIAVDEQGNVVNGDHILYILGKDLASRGGLIGNTVVTTIMSNMGLYQALSGAGIAYEQTTVGDKYVYERMAQKGYALGGEQSGHIILKKYATTGDGILTAIMLTEVMARQKAPLSRLASPVTMFPQVCESIPVADKDSVIGHPRVQGVLQVCQTQLGRQGRILLRKSGTEPVVRVMVEAKELLVCQHLAQTMKETILSLQNREE